MTRELQNDIKFYCCLILAGVLMIISLFLPPIGIIAESVLYGAIILLSFGGLASGMDIVGVLKEFNHLKELKIKEKETEQKND